MKLVSDGTLVVSVDDATKVKRVLVEDGKNGDLYYADRPQGEWIEVDDASISCRCSVCGWEAHLYEDDVYGMPYCPNCGARMKGADDE